MLLSDTGFSGSNKLFIKTVSPEGQVFTAYFSVDTLIEEMKNRAVEFFYPTGENGSGRYKIVRVCDATTLHDFLTLAQEQVVTEEELLLVERRVPEAGALDLGALRAPQQNAIAAATASLPAPQNTIRQPDLQSLLSTNELSSELRKILISLIEAGARLAAAGRNFENTLAQLTMALDDGQTQNQNVVRVITHDVERFNPDFEAILPSTSKDELFKRAVYLKSFLDKFRAWTVQLSQPVTTDALAALEDLGFCIEDAEKALKLTGANVPAAASWLIGERGSSVFELVKGLPDGVIQRSLLKQPQIQRGLLNTRLLVAFIGMVGRRASAALWLGSQRGSPVLSQISRTYHAEKYCLAVNQFSESQRKPERPSTSRQGN